MNKKEFLRIVKFTLFSISAGIVQIGSFTILTLIFPTWNYWACYIPSVVLSVVWNFTFNRKFTFKSANNVPLAMLLIGIYYAAFTPLSAWAGEALEQCGWNEFLVLVLTMLVNFVTEFLYDKFIVFGKSTDTAVSKKKGVTENAVSEGEVLEDADLNGACDDAKTDGEKVANE